MLFGVADGTRTHDNQDHNLGLYQLSYSHQMKNEIIGEIFLSLAVGREFARRRLA